MQCSITSSVGCAAPRHHEIAQRSSDTLFAFALRAVERVISDQSRTNREIINRLWEVLNDPHLNEALGIARPRRLRLMRLKLSETVRPRNEPFGRTRRPGGGLTDYVAVS
jgi:hypothetical protein